MKQKYKCLISDHNAAGPGLFRLHPLKGLNI